MSRIGRKKITIPAGVTVTVSAEAVVVKGTKGELTHSLPTGIKVQVVENEIEVTRTNDERETKALHGLMRSLVNNMIIGVSEGFKKTLELVGTGYRVSKKGQGVQLAVGFSHPVDYTPLVGVTLDVEGNNLIHVSGADKQKVGQVSAEIRAIRPPEPYRGKGIKYSDEVVRRKPGKTAGAAA